ncbi:hypothetical protein F5Y02DRAFT_363212 [Annulohypoxylon stygium]|nr:hypothetical protein F5Y02DRAFT_363212 [Annulohypoxylon stygium]
MKDPGYSKRKHGGPDNRPFKKSKGGANGRWQTPHHKAKLEALRAKGLEAGDVGLSTTCVKGKERQALEELMDICEQYGATLYNIPIPYTADPDLSDSEGDIEASIQKEVQSLKPSSSTTSTSTNPNPSSSSPFEPIRLDLDCLLFMRTHSPVDPVALAHRICVDARDDVGKEKWTGRRRSRFLNRFTPVTASGKATEAGLVEVARKVLGEHFKLAEEKVEADGKDADGDGGEKEESEEVGGGDENEKKEGEGKDGKMGEEEEKMYTYAIRPTFRAHNLLKRNDVITKVANMIDPRHKVNLTAPDKVILIDIYQSFCGMSVVDGDWDSLKRYNLHEIHMEALKAMKESAKEAKEKEEKVEADKPET